MVSLSGDVFNQNIRYLRFYGKKYNGLYVCENLLYILDVMFCRMKIC